MADLLREPYVLEFLNLPDALAFRESDLEEAIVSQLQKFLMEISKLNQRPESQVNVRKSPFIRVKKILIQLGPVLG